ncbi:MAG: ribose-phosphate pyrophosphokinase [Aquabacterium sp.]|jgi:ribose-phosphate pyrophosphokinase|uniref:ribose-phosphate pyrophosphokinase n=1 Tax=Aquabacterium sp. TaxID=1872578 RepID=UPI001B51480D|nr:ribose-phosphate pyrophosphokinase [Aquabacterium sp.]MBP7131290.1 ribose-phosphate pyrophosphokinase [Aquabacterium sp.]MBP9062797.1 ribose-phosphate pyrophosphokinase [Aquabacterium sp.]
MSALLLYFEDEQAPALRLAEACGLPAACVGRHRFPDLELRLKLPVDAAGKLPSKLVIYRSLDKPNDKLVELLLVSEEARKLGAQHILLVAPYLAYMRQDIAFHPGEIVSQTIVGRFLSKLFDGLITVDPHLHRISRLDEAFPGPYAIALSGAPKLAELIAKERPQAMLMGPDGESAQWIASAAAVCGFDHGVCTKVRHGDRDVHITLPDGVVVQDRHVVLLDDMASSGRTLVEACKLLRAAGARSVDVAVTHALFAADALDVIRAAGIEHIWSTDSVIHNSNAVSLAPLMADSVQHFLSIDPEA